MRATDAPPRLHAQQAALIAHLRDPEHAPAPAGIEQRRLAVYRDLLFHNIEALLAGNFPVIRALLGDPAWPALVRGFFRDHRSRTPLFPQIAGEFLVYLEQRAGGPGERGRADDRRDTSVDNHDDHHDQDHAFAAAEPPLPPYLRELAHYEWVELALQISDERVDAIPHEADGDLLRGAPVLSPLAWPLAYRWPVHRIGPDFQPNAPPATPTLLLVRRQDDGSVRFSELSPLAFALLQRLDAAPHDTGLAHLQALAIEAGVTDADGFIAQGGALFAQLRASGVLLGTVPVEADDEHAAPHRPTASR